MVNFRQQDLMVQNQSHAPFSEQPNDLFLISKITETFKQRRIFFFCFMVIIHMLKKNQGNKFHTAAARVLFTARLPPDFFIANLGKKRSNSPQLQLAQGIKHIQHSFSSSNDNMLFTFNRQNSPARSEMLPIALKKTLLRKSPRKNIQKQIEKLPLIPLLLNQQSHKQEGRRERKMQKISSRVFLNRRMMRQARTSVKGPSLLKCT